MPLIWRSGLFSPDASAAFWASALHEVIFHIHFSVKMFFHWILCSNWLSTGDFVVERLTLAFSGFFRPPWTVGNLDVAPGHSSRSGRGVTWDADDVDIDLGRWLKLPETKLRPNLVLLLPVYCTPSHSVGCSSGLKLPGYTATKLLITAFVFHSHLNVFLKATPSSLHHL